MVTAATARSQNHTLAVTVVNVPVTRKQSPAILLPRRPLPVHHVRWELEFLKLVAAAGPGPGRGLGGRHLPQPQPRCQSGGGTGAAWAVQIGSN